MTQITFLAFSEKYKTLNGFEIDRWYNNFGWYLELFFGSCVLFMISMVFHPQVWIIDYVLGITVSFIYLSGCLFITTVLYKMDVDWDDFD